MLDVLGGYLTLFLYCVSFYPNIQIIEKILFSGCLEIRKNEKKSCGVTIVGVVSVGYGWWRDGAHPRKRWAGRGARLGRHFVSHRFGPNPPVEGEESDLISGAGCLYTQPPFFLRKFRLELCKFKGILI